MKVEGVPGRSCGKDEVEIGEIGGLSLLEESGRLPDSSFLGIVLFFSRTALPAAEPPGLEEDGKAPRTLSIGE